MQMPYSLPVTLQFQYQVVNLLIIFTKLIFNLLHSIQIHWYSVRTIQSYGKEELFLSHSFMHAFLLLIQYHIFFSMDHNTFLTVILMFKLFQMGQKYLLVGFCLLVTRFHPFLSTSLLSKIKYSLCILYWLCFRIGHFSKDLWLHYSEKGIKKEK